MSDAKDFQSRFIEFLQHSGPKSKDTLDDDLRLMGFDPQKLGNHGSKLASDLFEEQLNSERQTAHRARIRASWSRPSEQCEP